MPLTGSSDPGAVVSSDVVDSVWGNRVRDNQVTYQGTFIRGHYVDYSGTHVQVSSTDETAFITYTIPGNSLGTANTYHFDFEILVESILGDEAGVLSLDYGTTTLVASVGGIAGQGSTDAISQTFKGSGYLKATGASNTQRGAIHLERGEGIVEGNYSSNGTAAEDSTGDLDMVLNFQFGNAGAVASLLWYRVEYHQE